ncbi:MAG: PQQ-binding-like beta-propeller repeat protein, partial [Dehalococcoidales bacterium]|nr:PQQ-binding-like beta-propeller repeat protein [Dehalococcoidales bacterium]
MTRNKHIFLGILTVSAFFFVPWLAVAADSDLIWSSPSEVPVNYPYFTTAGASVAVNQNVYTVGADGGVWFIAYGMSMNAKIEKIDASTGSLVWSRNLGSAMYPQDIISDGSSIYIAGWTVGGSPNGGFIQKRSIVDGSFIWSYSTGEMAEGISMGPGGIFTVLENHLEKRDASTGAIIWSIPLPSVTSGANYGIGNDIDFDGISSMYVANSRLLSGSVAGYLEKRNASDGALLWSAALGANKVVTSMVADSSNEYIAGVVLGNYWETAPAFFEKRNSNGDLVFNISGSAGVTPVIAKNNSALFTIDKDYFTKRNLDGSVLWQKVTGFVPMYPPLGRVMSIAAEESAVYFGTATFDGPVLGPSYPYRWLINKYASIDVPVACTSSPNACGSTSTGTVVNGVCSAVTPANPSGYGSSCTSTANACGSTNTGTIQCNGSCSASAPANPSGYGSACTSSANACGSTNTGTINCSGACTASTPANPSGYGSSCTSSANACGSTNTGTINCSGACTASTPANPSNYGSACTSSANACGTTNTGTINCSGACTASTPANPSGYGSSCTSAANACGQTTSGTISCSGSCSASAPSNASCPVADATLSASPRFVNHNGRSTLSWGSTNATSCSAPSGNWSNAGSLSGSGLTDRLTSNATFTFQCANAWSTSALQSVTVSVGAQAPTITPSRSPTTLGQGQSMTTSWSTTNATALNLYCTGVGQNTNNPMELQGSPTTYTWDTLYNSLGFRGAYNCTW